MARSLLLLVTTLLCLCRGIVGSVMDAGGGGWESFKARHGKVYGGPAEEAARRKVWQDNVKMVERHNREYEAGRATYALKETEFSDLTEKEFRARMTVDMEGMMMADAGVGGGGRLFTYDGKAELPKSVDWRTKACYNFIATFIQPCCDVECSYSTAKTAIVLATHVTNM